MSDVKLVYDAGARALVARVAFAVQPERVLTKAVAAEPDVRKAFMDRAMRVRLESSNLVTGAKDLSIEYSRARVPTDLPREGDALVLPSDGGGLDGLTASIADIATKVDRIPFQEIGDNANATLASVQHLVTQLDTSAAPALAQLPAIAEQMAEAARGANGVLGASGYGQNSDFQRGMERMMREVNDTARSVRGLADYLDRHPESLLRGRMQQGGGRGVAGAPPPRRPCCR